MENYVSDQAIKSPSNLTPRLINTFFLLALQHYFISHPEYSWNPDDNKTEIDIHPEFEEDDNSEKGMPQIVVQTGQVTINPSGIGTGLSAAYPRVVVRDNKYMYQPAIWDSQLQFNVEGSIMLTIMGMTTDDVNELAFETAMFLIMIKYDAAKILQIQNMGSVSISPAQPSSKTGWENRYISQLIIPYTFTLTRSWEPVSSGPILKEILTEMSVKSEKIRTNRFDFNKKHEEQPPVGVPSSKIIQPGDDKQDISTSVKDKAIDDFMIVKTDSVVQGIADKKLLKKEG